MAAPSQGNLDSRSQVLPAYLGTGDPSSNGFGTVSSSEPQNMQAQYENIFGPAVRDIFFCTHQARSFCMRGLCLQLALLETHANTFLLEFVSSSGSAASATNTQVELAKWCSSMSLLWAQTSRETDSRQFPAKQSVPFPASQYALDHHPTTQPQ